MVPPLNKRDYVELLACLRIRETALRIMIISKPSDLEGREHNRSIQSKIRRIEYLKRKLTKLLE